MSKDIEALIERLEKATGPDRELDRDIAVATGYGEISAWGVEYICNDKIHEIHPEVTASIDAALALCERMLPGWRWGVASHSIKDGVYSEGPYIGKPKHVDGFRAHVSKPSPLRPMPHIADARTAPLAILLALLRSLNQEESRSEESKNG